MKTKTNLRPGVTNAFLTKANVHRIGSAEARNLCGISEPGLFIPYRTISGKPVSGNGPGGFGRLRLDTPKEGRKYHQRNGSKPYAYIPHNLDKFTATIDLVVVEGEFKAMALADAGFAAIGIGGISSAFTGNEFVPGLREALRELYLLKRVLFLGDSDTALLFAFSREAVKIAGALDKAVFCPRIGLDGPGKGIDDVREAVGFDKFTDYWTTLVAKSVPVLQTDTPERLFVRLLRQEKPSALSKIIRGESAS